MAAANGPVGVGLIGAGNIGDPVPDQPDELPRHPRDRHRGYSSSNARAQAEYGVPLGWVSTRS